MSSKTAGELVDPAVLRAQHSIIYEESTSDIKDDVAQLGSAVKSGSGPLSRTEALFLLFYHALRGEDGATELVAAGLVNTLLGVIDQPDASAPDKTCCAGILVALCGSGGEEACEAVMRGRAGNAPAVTVLHNQLRGARAAMRMHAARCLALIAAQHASRSALLRALDNKLPHCKLYCEVFTGANLGEAGTVGQLANYLAALVKGRDDLRDEAVQGGLLEALLTALRFQKVDSAVRGCLELLEELLNEKRAWGKLAAKGGIEVLVDLLGPPPSTITKWENERYRHIIDPAWAAEQDKRREEWVQADTAARQAEAAKAALGRPVTSGSGRSFRSVGTRTGKSTKSQQSDGQQGDGDGEGGEGASVPAANNGGMTARDGGMTARGNTSPSRRASQKELKPLQSQASSVSTLALGDDCGEPLGSARLPPVPGAEEVMLPAPPKTREQLMSINQAGLKWHALVTLPTFSAAAGCLYALAQDKQHMEAISARLGASRLVPLLLQAMEDDGSGGKKKGAKKKKGLSLTPEQTHNLVRITGALKFLCLNNVNRYRVAKLGGVKPLILIYENCAHTLLRRNAQVILSNAALLAENGQLLLDAKLPEEFLVALPLRLTPDEIEQLLIEFPDAPLGAKSATQQATAALSINLSLPLK